MAAALPERTRGVRRLHNPTCVFLIAYGAAKLAELFGWSRLHDDVMAMLGLGSGVVSGLLLAGKGVESLLIGATVFSIVRVSRFWLLAAIAGWTTDLGVLSIVAAACGDLGRLLDHGLSFLAFAALLVTTYMLGGERTARPPVADATRQDLPVREPHVTRQDLPIGGRRAWPPEDRRTPPPDEASRSSG